MSDGLSYYQQSQGGIYGNPDGGGSDPVTTAALQEKYAMMNMAYTQNTDYVPPSYVHAGSGNPATIGWTVQNQRGGSVPFPYYNPNVGTTPDWTNDANPIGAGSYDMNPVVTSFAPNRLNRGPIGDGFFQGMDGQPPDPNHLPQDVGGSIGGFNEY